MSLCRRAVFVLTLIIMITLSGCGVSPAKRPAATASASETAVKVGDTYVFGQYEQDNDLSNGKEPIEWIVIDVVNGKALISLHL